MPKEILTSADIIGKDRLSLTLPFNVAAYIKDEAKVTGDSVSVIVERIIRAHYEETHG